MLATNIAETSITIDDVSFVIDCGRHKENRYEPRRKMEMLVEDFASQAAPTLLNVHVGRPRVADSA